jgi:hypothetical protein
MVQDVQASSNLPVQTLMLSQYTISISQPLRGSCKASKEGITISETFHLILTAQEVHIDEEHTDPESTSSSRNVREGA